MHWRCQCAVAAALVAALPAVDSFCSPAASSYRRTSVSAAVPAWTSSLGSGSKRGQRRAPTSLAPPRGTSLRMQGGAAYGGGGEDRDVPGGYGYSSSSGGANPGGYQRSSRSFSDGFDEGVPRLNMVFLTGYLGQDPQPKYFDSGRVVLNLSLAVKREYHPLERKALGIVHGEEETDWFQLEMWNRDAEYAAKVCKKGGRVGVTGGLSLNSWVDREGNDRTTVKILVQNLEVLDSRAEQAMRSDRSDSNLWESERLEKMDAAAAAAGGGGGGGGGLGGEAYQQQTAEDLEAKARKRAAEDKWWSAEPEPRSAAAGEGGGGGGSWDSAAASAGKGGESSWWEEEGTAGGGGGGTKGIDSDSLPSFFDS
ncbi:unnamed protein product [Ectocarpus fasciculatus]